MRLYDLGSCPEYEALSYCWGDDTNKLPILVDNKTLHVTKNLRSALRHLRHSSRPRLLWVDAVCINQDDLDERGMQVSIMRDIYRSAIRTVVWLGPRFDNSDSAISACRTLSQEDDALHESKSDGKVLFPSVSQGTDGPLMEPVKITPEIETSIEGLAQLPWFERVWVIQEIGVAKDTVIVCGWQQIEWDQLHRGIRRGLNNRKLETNFLGVAKTKEFENFLATAAVQHRDTSRPPAEQLLNLLIQFRVRKATNPADKVYSMLGLVENVDTLGLVPNYHLSPAAVFKNTTATILIHSRNLDILGTCKEPSIEELRGSLPSWVTDWSNSDRVQRCFWINHHGQTRRLRASGDSTASVKFLQDNSVLVLDGHVVDTISELGEVLKNMIDEIEPNLPEAEPLTSEGQNNGGIREGLQEIYEAIHSGTDIVFELSRIVEYLETFLGWEKLAEVNKKDGESTTPTKEHHMAVYWQTLCAGCMLNEYGETEKLFKEWYNSLNPIRNLIYFRVNRMPRTYKILGLLGYLRAVWREYGAFGDLMVHTTFRRLARTRDGYLCLVPAGARVGDSIVICKGGKTPLLLRPESKHWTLLGETYVHGMMDGERFNERACQEIMIK